VAATTQVRLLVRSFPTYVGHAFATLIAYGFCNKLFTWFLQSCIHFQAAIAQLAARRSHNPKVVSSILTGRIFQVICQVRIMCPPKVVSSILTGRIFQVRSMLCSSVPGTAARGYQD
jgi:hypothetical protein